MDLILLIFTFICGFLFCLGMHLILKRWALHIVRQNAGAIGREKKADQESRLMAFMLEVKAAHDVWKGEGGTDLKEFGLKKVVPIGLKYPDVLLKQGKNLMKMLEGDNKGEIGGLLEGLL